MNPREKEDLIQELYTNILRYNNRSANDNNGDDEIHVGNIIKKNLLGAYNPVAGFIKQEKSLKDISEALFFSGALHYGGRETDFSEMERLDQMTEAITEKGVIRYNGTVFDHMYIETKKPESTGEKEPTYNIRLGCVPRSLL
ncbi:MAG: hypothetical protein ACOCU6_00905 [Nanoarchaeota archaeon]